MITVMNLDKEVVFTIFGFVSICGPVFGVIFGGWISSKLGGYNDPRSIYLNAGASVFAIFMSVPIPYLGYDKVWL